MDSIENSAKFELCFINFYEQFAWFTAAAFKQQTFKAEHYKLNHATFLHQLGYLLM